MIATTSFVARPGAAGPGAARCRAGPTHRAPAGRGSDPVAVAARALLVRLSNLPPGAPGRDLVRARVIEWHLPLATYLARRFNGRGEPLADLNQVAAVGLIKAVDRYDPARGVDFAAYAVPTIVGEIKRHFRDTTWNVRVPRRMQELRLQLSTATEDLAHLLNRSPTTGEYAARLGVSPADVLAARGCASAYRPISTEQPVSGAADLLLINCLGSPDPGIEAVERRQMLRAALARLPVRERRIITLRFFAEMTQSQIAEDVGLSQMQISRLLTKSLTLLHRCLQTDAVERIPTPRAGRRPPGSP